MDIQANREAVNADFIKRVRSVNLELHVWTVNDAARSQTIFNAWASIQSRQTVPRDFELNCKALLTRQFCTFAKDKLRFPIFEVHRKLGSARDPKNAISKLSASGERIIRPKHLAQTAQIFKELKNANRRDQVDHL